MSEAASKAVSRTVPFASMPSDFGTPQGLKLNQGYSNYTQSVTAQTAAPPLAVRKGFAFPSRLSLDQTSSVPSAPMNRGRRHGGGEMGRTWPESQRLSAQRGGRAALATRSIR